MGRRVTIDSATLFNKGLELIEAHWLFGLPLDRVHAVVHPQSIVHALVELADGSWIAHLAPPDMRLPIQYALSHPERWDAPAPRADLARLGPLTFEAPDEERFPCLRVAREAARLGGTAPAAVNAADEVLVEAFLAGRIAFTAIGRGIETVLRRHAATADPTLEEVLAADRWARREAGGLVDERA
jgi:1-deoxy-D-xylulose-5-phosphate reductoisomerase